MKVRKFLRWRGGRAWFNALGWKPSGPSKAPQVRILSSPPNGGICQQEKQPDSHSGNLGSSPSTPAIFTRAWSNWLPRLPFTEENTGSCPVARAIISKSTYAVLLLGQSGCSPMRIMAACGAVATGTPVRSRPRWCA